MRKSTKTTIILLGIVILISAITSVLIFTLNDSSSKTDSSDRSTITPILPTQKEYEYTHTDYYAFVVSHTNTNLNNIDLDEITPQDIIYVYGPENSSSTFASLVQANLIKSTTDYNAFVDMLNSNPEQIGLVNINELDYTLKVLRVDDMFLFDRNTDLDKYPLKNSATRLSDSTQENETNYSHQKLTKIGHTGSLIAGRGVQYWIENKFNSDYSTFFESVQPLFNTFDFLSATMEAPLSGNGNVYNCPDPCFTFIGPEKFIDAVNDSGIGLTSLAANHIMDGGVSGLSRTIELLEQNGIKYTGASTVNNDEAGKPVLVDINGLKIAYLASNDTPGRAQWADENNPGAASISDWILDEYGNTVLYEPNENRIEYFLDRAKRLNPDLIVVIMHWGSQEYVAEALPYQKALAELLVEYGADVILGDHVHWVQEIEFMENSPVFYGVGNFVFDQMWSTETRQGITIELNFIDKKLVNFRLHPHMLDLYDQGKVLLLEETDTSYNETLERVWRSSR